MSCAKLLKLKFGPRKNNNIYNTCVGCVEVVELAEYIHSLLEAIKICKVYLLLWKVFTSGVFVHSGVSLIVLFDGKTACTALLTLQTCRERQIC